MFNKITLIGTVAKDITIEKTTSGFDYINNSLAVKRDYKNGDGSSITDFIPFKVMGKMTSILGNYCNKGDRVLLDGRLQIDTWEKDGKTQHNTYVIVDKIVLLGSPKKSSAQIQKEEHEDYLKDEYGYARKNATKEDSEDLPF